MTKLWWILSAICSLWLLVCIVARDLGDRRKQELHYIAQNWQNDITTLQWKLADVSQSLADDPRFVMSVDEGLRNTYSAMIKRVLENEEVSHASIHNRQCGYVYDQYQRVMNNVHYCRPKRVGVFYWLASQPVESQGVLSSESLAKATTMVTDDSLQDPSQLVKRMLLITRPLGENHLLTMGFEVSTEWIYGLFSSPKSWHFSVNMEAPDLDSNWPESVGVILTYLPVASPVLYDSHPITRHMPGVVSPWRSGKPNLYGALLICILAFLGVFVHYRLRLRGLWAKLTGHRTLIEREALELNMPTTSRQSVELDHVMTSWHERHSQLKGMYSESCREVTSLKLHVTKLARSLTFLGYHKALHREMKRQVHPLKENILQQKWDMLDIQEYVGMIQHSCQSDIFRLLSSWQQDVHQRGSRKFLRSRLERVDEAFPERSLLESELAQMFDAMDHLRSLFSSLHRLSVKIQDHGEYFSRLIHDWSGLYEQAHGCTLKRTFEEVKRQVSEAYSMDIVIQTPLWQEPSQFPSLLASMLRCVFFEVLSGHISKVKAFSQSPLSCVYVTVHYLNFPKEGVLLSCEDLYASEKTPQNNESSESSHKPDGTYVDVDVDVGVDMDESLDPAVGHVSVDRLGVHTYQRGKELSCEEQMEDRLVRRVKDIGRMFSVTLEKVTQDRPVSYSVFWLLPDKDSLKTQKPPSKAASSTPQVSSSVMSEL
ncbi:MAG: hypothetical protein OXC44_02370 [Proteobacteria bacterium]|nr:hypothetical protein [Pseudomonadota bacterium]